MRTAMSTLILSIRPVASAAGKTETGPADKPLLGNVAFHPAADRWDAGAARRARLRAIAVVAS
jgi:hypothetical protein